MSKGKKPNRPLSKATIALNEQLARKRGVRELAKRFLIVCEDGKSAPNYFRALKRHLNLSAASIEVVGSAGHTQPLQVVDRAITIRDRARGENSGTEPFDEVWCLIDGDYGAKIANARARATANNISLAVSTMCFEYWVLLHYENSSQPDPDCASVIKRLKKRLPTYDRGSFDFQETVLSVNDASQRAKRIRDNLSREFPKPEDQNPCSEVFLLIDALLGF